MSVLSAGRRFSSRSSFAALTLAAGVSLVGRASGQAPAPTQPEGAPPGESAKAGVVLPTLVHFEHAPYPAEAQAEGLEAVVALKLTIEKDGKVSAAEVMEPVGHGFDEAARQAALAFLFEPATRNGEPIRVTVQYSYRFTLSERPAESPEDAGAPGDAEAEQTGALGGRLEIAETGEPLAGVEVVVTLPDGTETRLLSDEQGRFLIDAAKPGRYRVWVAAPGFREISEQEDVTSGEATDVVYRASPETTEIEIVVEGERPAREVTRRTLQRRELERVPGTGGDALRALQSLPGIARPPGLAGFLIVRGSSPNDTNVFADGTLIPNAYHFGGLSSVVPTELLDRIDFYPSNFSARFGRVMGGVVDLALRAPDTRCYEDYGKASDRSGCYHGMAQLDLIDARALVQGPIGKSPYWSFALAGRRSWIDTWLKPVLEGAGQSVTSAPVYYDYQAIVDYKKGSSRFSLRGYGSDDRLEVIVTDPFAQDPGFGGNLRFGSSFYRLQALYEEQLSSKVSLSSMLSVGRDTLDFQVGTFFFNLEFIPIYLRNELSFAVNEGVKANFGFDFLAQPFDIAVRAPPIPSDQQPSSISSTPPQEVQTKSTMFRPGWYGELELQPSKALRVVPGVRFDFARDTGHPDISPRLNARYDLISGATPEEKLEGLRRRRTTLKGGAGVFAQPPQPEETNEIFGTPNIESNRAFHYALGVEQELTDQVELSVEGFYKDLWNQVVQQMPNVFGNRGLGSVIGMEALLKYKPDDRFFGWISYTLSKSVRQNDADSEEYPFQYDQRHNLIALGSYRLGRGWEFGARFRLTSGFPATPVIGAIYSSDNASYTPIQGKLYGDTLPLSHQLDLRIDKRWQFKSWRFSAYLDVRNVYNHMAVEAFTYNFDYSQRQYQTGLPIIPNLGLRGEF